MALAFVLTELRESVSNYISRAKEPWLVSPSGKAPAYL